MKIISSVIKSKIPDQLKTGLCHWLNERVRNWSEKKTRTVFLAFSFLGIGVSTYVIAKAITGKTESAFLKRGSAPMPFMPRAYPDYRQETSAALCKRIEQVKKCLDSLAIHDTARYQAILKANPGLLENIHSIENLLTQPNKK